MLITTNDFTIANSPLPAWTQWRAIDPGWLYIIRNGELYKIGKTTDPRRRLKEARTWLPTGDIIGVKPFWNIHTFERSLLCGIANHWLEGEWHQFPNETYVDFLVSGFGMFDDHDRAKNTVDLGYWINGSGMAEVVTEQQHRRMPLRRWQREC